MFPFRNALIVNVCLMHFNLSFMVVWKYFYPCFDSILLLTLQVQNSSGAAELELERIKLEREKLTQAVQQWKKLYQDLQNMVVDDLLSEP